MREIDRDGDKENRRYEGAREGSRAHAPARRDSDRLPVSFATDSAPAVPMAASSQKMHTQKMHSLKSGASSAAAAQSPLARWESAAADSSDFFGKYSFGPFATEAHSAAPSPSRSLPLQLNKSTASG